MNVVTESDVEAAVLSWFEGLGYTVLHGPDVAPGELHAERTNYSEVVLVGRLRAVLARINTTIPPETLDEALRNMLRPEHPSLYGNNHRFHTFLTGGQKRDRLLYCSNSAAHTLRAGECFR